MTESVTVAGVTCAQDMMYAKNIVESVGLKVKQPMRLEIDNRGAVDMAQIVRQAVGENIWKLECFG